MTTPSDETHGRSYGCTFGCGNPYDVILTMVNDASTEMLCIPCFIKMASDMLTAMVSSTDPNVQAAMEWASKNLAAQVPGPAPKKGRKNAPATADSPDIFDAYDGIEEIDLSGTGAP